MITLRFVSDSLIKYQYLPWCDSSQVFPRLTAKMWKLLIAAAVLFSLGEGQRSFYAPRPGSYPKLLPRYRKNETDSVANTNVATRGGDEGPDLPSSSAVPFELQGTLEEERFVQRVSQWPKERQPFWFRNRYAISSMRDRNIDGGSINGPFSGGFQRPVAEFQSPFLGRPRINSRN